MSFAVFTLALLRTASAGDLEVTVELPDQTRTVQFSSLATCGHAEAKLREDTMLEVAARPSAPEPGVVDVELDVQATRRIDDDTQQRVRVSPKLRLRDGEEGAVTIGDTVQGVVTVRVVASDFEVDAECQESTAQVAPATRERRERRARRVRAARD